MLIPIRKLDSRWFPRWCCDVEYRNAKAFMDHFLPTHMVEVPSC